VLSGREIAYAALGRIDKANVDWRRQLAAGRETQHRRHPMQTEKAKDRRNRPCN